MKSVRALRHRAIGGALGAVLLASGAARGDEPSKADLARARAAFHEAVALASASNCAAALVKYKEVAQIKVSPEVAFNTADCEARLGKLVSSLGNYRVAARLASDDKRAAAVLKEVPSRIEDLEARIPKLTVTRGAGAGAASIELDGNEIGAASIGAPLPVDPGPHVIVARVAGKEALRETITLGESEAKTFDVSIAAPVNVEPPPAHVPDEPAIPAQPSRIPGIALTAAGGAALVLGLSFLAPRQAAVDKLRADCNRAGHCPIADQDVDTRGRVFTGLTEVLVPVGAAATIAGVVMLVRTRPQKAKPLDVDADKKESAWRSIRVAAGAPGAPLGGLSLAGTF